jgi:lipopolysaccharide transport system ATP-binding protein
VNDIVIRAENLSKKYIIGHTSKLPNSATLRDAIARTARNLLRTTSDMFSGRAMVAGDTTEEFWALKDVNFEIKRGDAVGIIGRNGAGKSTLLKILSRITEPSAGRVEMKGRVASLLEVGTGFHPELTGRENIFLNGAILGMGRAEIRRKFDEIVAFAEVERFLDTPVKRYSSGMYVRLAFAVAAHLEPEILIIDEVLAVGDAEFQKKCLGKMGEVAGQGRTVLVVTHNMSIVAKLCKSVLTLTAGRASPLKTDVEAQLQQYLGAETATSPFWQGCAPKYCPWIEIREVSVEQALERKGLGSLSRFKNSVPIRIKITGEINQKNPALTFGIAVFSEGGDLLFWSYTTDTPPEDWPEFDVGPFEASVDIPARFLNAGVYRVEVIASLHYQSWLLEPGKSEVCITIAIQGGLSDSPLWHERRPGLLAPVLLWNSHPQSKNLKRN